MTIKQKRHNETNTFYLTQLEKKRNTLLSAKFFAKELSKTPQEKGPEKCSTAERSFLEVVEKDEREIKEFFNQLSKEKEDESYQESKNEKRLLKKFLNVNKGDVKKFLKMEKYDKKPMHMMDPILDGGIYGLTSKYDLEQFEGAKSIFNWFIQNNKDIGSQLKMESYEAQV